MKLNHLMLVVRNLVQSRDWYVSNLRLKIEFEVPNIKFAALEDTRASVSCLQEGEISGDRAANIKIYFEADNVDELHHRLERAGIHFDHPPQNKVWGYGRN
jgi:catechol 2,3-dioxygenase-like lactoylglutathione lyase family enzyme